MSWDLDNIGNKLSNLTVYDVKSLYRQARNYALNVSEIEAKVDEATNSDPWGASTTLMWEIAQATHNYADFGEIMQAIFRRFMEKEAHEWREIYKVRFISAKHKPLSIYWFRLTMRCGTGSAIARVPREEWSRACCR